MTIFKVLFLDIKSVGNLYDQNNPDAKFLLFSFLKKYLFIFIGLLFLNYFYGQVETAIF